LLDLFWKIHDPTTLNRQGADIGPQYRSIILYSSPEQEAAAKASIAKAAPSFRNPIVTELKPLETYWKAEGYHQDYFRRNPDQGYCQVVVAPKVDKAQEWIRTNP
ncbi:MAG TPA: peptide-methionine (S)-S-oxide reductase, partial [Spirochaetales bacterium]|nr:peptide-methionine (S)-S-oxide reductase [Spirochaetales bacterium]